MTRKRSYQKGSVELHNGQWSVRYREFDHATGKWNWKREQLGQFKNKKAARKASEPIMARVNERNNTEPEKLYLEVRFKDFIAAHWKAYRMSAKHQPSTIDNHDSLVKNHLTPFFGEKRMREVRPSDVSDFLQMKAEEKLAGNTMQNLYGLLRLMFDIAEQFDVIEKSPVRPKLHKPEFEKVEKPVLSSAQIRAVLGEFRDEQVWLFALLLAVTGMRMGEALALRWMDFNAAKSELSINHTLYRMKLKKPKTESSKNTLRLDLRVASLLLSHRDQSAFQAESDFIFCRPDGRPLNVTLLRRRLYKAMDAVGIKRVAGQYGFHILRHSAGTLLYARSRDLKMVQGTLRHADISTTSDIYVHLDDEVLGEGTVILADEILANCDPTVTQKSRMVS